MSEPSPSTPPSPGASGSDGTGSCPPPPLPPVCGGRAPKRQRLENGKVLCRFGGCCKEVSPNHAREHERTHTGERPYPCDVQGCEESFAQWVDLKRHTMVHNNARPYVCTAENCEARYVQASDLKKHFERNHTELGMQRRKKKEERLFKFLTSSGYVPDREPVVHVCNTATKKLARIDFALYKTDRVVLVECEEDEHRRETVLCEVTRMLDVAAQHAMKNGLSLHFVRFNPDGFTVDRRPQKPKMAERYKELILAIEEPVTAPLTITYICYTSTAGVADVTMSQDFPPDLREVCRTRVA